jgi:alkylation response protein AidB-like acyl-CoA dehydrogenase
MVDFTLTEEQRDMRELAHDFAEKEIRPVAWGYDRDATWPQQLIETAWQVPAISASAARSPVQLGVCRPSMRARAGRSIGGLP